MKLLRTNPDQFVLQFAKREFRLLNDTLQLYPLVPPAHHRIASPEQPPVNEEFQHLLDEALAEDRRQKREQILKLFNELPHTNPPSRGVELTLTRSQIDWLLQVLNDVRVGSWLALGEPDPEAIPDFNEQNARFLIALEVCGMFQSVLLQALGMEQSPQWG